MVCDAPIKRGPNKGKPARGTHAGYQRHIKVGEPPCEDCKAGHAVTERERWNASDKPRETARNYYRRNRDRIDEYHRRRRSRNPEPERARKRKWLEANRARHNARNARWRRNNPERARAMDRRTRQRRRAELDAAIREWRQRHPEKVAEYNRTRRARLRNALVIDFSIDQLMDRLAYWGNRCWMCGDEANAVDHVIPLARGGPHCLANLRPACGPCNSSKGTKDWRTVPTEGRNT